MVEENKKNGFIKIHRSIWENPICNKPNYFVIWIYLLSYANHKDKKVIWNNKKMLIKRGSFVGSIKGIADNFELATSTVSRILDYFISDGMLEKKSNNKFTLFYIKNYDDYNNLESQQIASRSPADTTKKGKKVKNDTNVSEQSFGREDINQITEHLKTKLGTSLDGSIGQNRQYAKLLLDKFKKDYPTFNTVEQIQYLIDHGIVDNFHAKNITNFKYLYFNANKIINSIKKGQPITV